MTEVNRPLPWFRLYAEAIDDPKLRLLAFEDRWHFIALLCCKAKGVLDEGADWDRMQRKIAVMLGVQVRELEEIHRRLMEGELVDEWLQPVSWSKRQSYSDQDPTRAERQKRYRERKRNASRNGDVTRLDRDVDVDRDLDTEGDLNTASSDADSRDASASATPRIQVPYQKIVDLYHEVCPELPRCEKLTDKRRSQIRARWVSGELPDLDAWRTFLNDVRQSDFLMGRVEPPPNRKRFLADLEWLTKESNYVKFTEGRYHG